MRLRFKLPTFGLATQRSVERLQEANVYLRGKLEEYGLAQTASSLYTQDSWIYQQRLVQTRLQVMKSRQFYDLNALYWAAIELVVAFVVGRGLQAPKVDQQSDGAESKNKLLSQFWSDNAETFSGFRQLQGTVRALATDGTLPLFLFPNPLSSRWQVRLGDVLAIDRILVAPDDPAIPMLVKYADQRISYDSYGNPSMRSLADGFRFYKTEYYDAWVRENGSDSLQGWPVVKPEDQQTILYVCKVGTDIRYSFGMPPLFRSITWLHTSNGLAADMATFTSTATTFAARRKLRSATPAQVQAFAGRIRSGLPTAGADLTPQAGRITVENDKADWETVDVKTGGTTVFGQTLEVMLNMVYSGLGFPRHYFGDPTAGNRATTTNMELPVVKRMECEQSFWLQVMTDIAHIVLGQPFNSDQRDIIVQDFPAVSERELVQTIQGAVAAHLGGGLDDQSFAEICVSAFGIRNSTEVLERIAAEAEKTAATPITVVGSAATQLQEAKTRLMIVREMRRLNGSTGVWEKPK